MIPKLTSIRITPVSLFVVSLCFAGCSEEPENPAEWFSITALAASGESVYAATDEDGLYYLEDEKDSWQYIEGFLFGASLFAVSETTVYANGSGGIRRLNKDNSELWVNTSSIPGWGRKGMWSLLAVGDTIYAGMGSGRVYRVTGNEPPSWATVANTAISSLAISGTTLYAGSGRFPNLGGGEGVFRSLDGGDSWTPINTGLTERDVTSLAVSGTIVYAGTSDGVFRLEHDDSWTHVGLSGSAVALLIAEPGTTRLYAGTWDDGVFRAPDGVSWQYWGLAGLPVTALAVSEKYLYAGTLGRPLALGRAGIFRRRAFSSTTKGYGLWTPINRGLTKIWH